MPRGTKRKTHCDGAIQQRWEPDGARAPAGGGGGGRRTQPAPAAPQPAAAADANSAPRAPAAPLTLLSTLSADCSAYVARDTARDGDCGFEALARAAHGWPLPRDAALRMREAIAAAIEASPDLRAAFVADSEEGRGDLNAFLQRVRTPGRHGGAWLSGRLIAAARATLRRPVLAVQRTGDHYAVVNGHEAGDEARRDAVLLLHEPGSPSSAPHYKLLEAAHAAHAKAQAGRAEQVRRRVVGRARGVAQVHGQGGPGRQHLLPRLLKRSRHLALPQHTARRRRRRLDDTASRRVKSHPHTACSPTPRTTTPPTACFSLRPLPQPDRAALRHDAATVPACRKLRTSEGQTSHAAAPLPSAYRSAAAAVAARRARGKGAGGGGAHARAPGANPAL
jgi:hypothetical protein